MSKNYNYEVTLREAMRRFCEREIMSIPPLTGATVGKDGQLELKFLNRTYSIDSSGQVVLPPDQEEVPLTIKILLLHYLAQGSEAIVNDKFVSFKELPGGTIYIQPFTNRAIRPLVSLFGEHPTGLSAAGSKLGGVTAKLGDVGITLYPLPRVPVTFVLWGGDDEFPPSGNILFDSSAPQFLPTEDFAVLASLLVAELKRAKSE
jgi:hypothetical protein